MLNNSSEKLVSQVVRHVQHILDSGALNPGGRLPSERTVASDIGVSRNTVTAAYNQLEQRGLIRRIRGKGALMCSPQNSGTSFSWSGKISPKAHLLDEPVLELLARGCASGLPHPLSAGTPSLECFPTDEYHACINKLFTTDFPSVLAIAPTEGQWKLRCSIGRWTNVEPNHVMITSGAQEGIDLLARCLIAPGDCALVENPTYPGAIQCLRAAGARLIGWNTDWCLEKLEELLLRYRPKLIFTMPSFQNPTGNVMDLVTRSGMLDLASRYHVPIIEDDVYSKTYLGGRSTPESLLKLDSHSQVIYISTFSKILAPGLRVGWIVAPLYMIKQLSLMKMRANLFTGGLTQLVLSELIENGGLDRHLSRLRSHHCNLRNAAVSVAWGAAEKGLLSFTSPTGGLYLWCRLEPGIDLDHLLASAEQRGVSVAPGHAFFADKSDQTFVRICYTAASEAKVRRGVEILAETLCELQTATAVNSEALR